MKRALLFITIFIASFGGAGFAQAQAKGYAGVLIGLSVPDADDTSARTAYGVLGGARLDGEFGLGGYYLKSSKDETINTVETSFDYSLYGLEGSFHFEGVADGAYMAARVGLAKVTVGSQNYSPLAWGLNFGYDHFLKENLSLGVEAGFMAVQGAKKTGANLDGFTMLNFLVAAKMWF